VVGVVVRGSDVECSLTGESNIRGSPTRKRGYVVLYYLSLTFTNTVSYPGRTAKRSQPTGTKFLIGHIVVILKPAGHTG
jgi:hypothetical protein